MLESLFQIAGLKIINYEIVPNVEIKNTVLDNNKCENFGEKATKSSSILADLYNNLFNPYNKPVCIIKPFPIIKEAYVKSSSLSSETSNPNTTLTQYLSEKMAENKNKQLTFNTDSDIDEEGSLSSHPSSSDNTVVIDLKVLTGVDEQNNGYIVLKDINDPTSDNLISILDKPEHIKVTYDKEHIQNKYCANHKYLSFEKVNLKSQKYQAKMYKIYSMEGPVYSSSHDISLSIKSQAVNEINNNNLIIESENCNISPLKKPYSFVSSSNSLPSEDWKIKIPIPRNLESIRIIPEISSPNTMHNCADCNNEN